MANGELKMFASSRALPGDVFEGWLARLGSAVEARDGDAFAELFNVDGYWRDLLSFTWERRTFHGADDIRSAFARMADVAAARNFRPALGRTPPRFTRRSGRQVVEGWFAFDTAVGGGVGFARLFHNEADPMQPDTWLLLTTLHALQGGEEKIGDRRPSGDGFSQIASPENWLDHRGMARSFADRDPEVLIVGAGHSGLMLAARLQQMGVDVLVVERAPRVGDNWRGRYHNLTLHNELDGNHFPYLPFPETWPVWLPKDMLAGWLESYAEFLELNVWTGTELSEAAYDAEAQVWRVALKLPDGSERRMVCPQLVAAIGLSGGIPKKPDMPGLASFAGEVLHSAEFTTGKAWAGKRAIVVGTGNSGHDIAQDLYVSGAESVAIMQRGATCVLSLKPSATISYAIYKEGLPPEDVDLMVAGLPYPMLIESYQWITKRTSTLDRDLLAGLQEVGFKTHTGADATGFQLLYLRGAGGYYIDVGGSQLLIDRKIGLMQYEDIERFVPEGLLMKDGRVEPADLVVLATGFEKMQESIRALLGDEVAERVGPIWGFDAEGNMRNMWTRTAQDGFWVMGGAILEARINSRYLALEIAAALRGLLPDRGAMPLPPLSRPAE